MTLAMWVGVGAGAVLVIIMIVALGRSGKQRNNASSNDTSSSGVAADIAIAAVEVVGDAVEVVVETATSACD